MDILAPFGKGNEKPSFAEREVEMVGLRVLGEHRNVVKLSLMDRKGYRIEGIYFTDGDAFLEEKGERKKMHIVYYPRIAITEIPQCRRSFLHISLYRIRKLQ